MIPRRSVELERGVLVSSLRRGFLGGRILEACGASVSQCPMTRWPRYTLSLRPALARGLQVVFLSAVVLTVGFWRPSGSVGLAMTLGLLMVVGIVAGAAFASMHAWLSRGRFWVDEGGLWVGWPCRRGPIPWSHLAGSEAGDGGLVCRDDQGREKVLSWGLSNPADRQGFVDVIQQYCVDRVHRLTLPLPAGDQVLTTARLHLRPWRASDWVAFRRAYLAPEMTRGQQGPRFGRRISRHTFRRLQASNAQPWAWFWALEDRAENRVIGLAEATLVSCAPSVVRIGYGVFGEKRRQGYAKEAVIALVEAFGHSAGVDQVEAILQPANVASRRVLEHSGFEECSASTSADDGMITLCWTPD